MTTQAPSEAGPWRFNVDWDSEDAAWIATTRDRPSMAAHGDTPEAALASLLEAINAPDEEVTT